jgi:hypothetical protein
MKKAFLIVPVLLLSTLLHSQTKKGTFQVGVSGLPIIYFDNSLPNGYSLRANVGYFPLENFSIGLSPYFGQVAEISSLGTNLYTRYYFLSSRVSLFAEASSGLGSVKYDENSNLNGTMNSLALGPGVALSIKDKLALEIIVQYARLRNITHPRDTQLGNTFIPSIGLQYFIGKK